MSDAKSLEVNRSEIRRTEIEVKKMAKLTYQVNIIKSSKQKNRNDTGFFFISIYRNHYRYNLPSCFFLL